MSAPQRTHADWSRYPPAQLPHVVVPVGDVYDEDPFPEPRWAAWKYRLAWAGVLLMDVLCWVAIIGLLALIARALGEIARVRGWR